MAADHSAGSGIVVRSREEGRIVAVVGDSLCHILVVRSVAVGDTQLVELGYHDR